MLDSVYDKNKAVEEAKCRMDFVMEKVVVPPIIPEVSSGSVGVFDSAMELVKK